MLHLLVAAALLQPTPQQVIARFSKFMSGMTTLSLDIKMKVPNGTGNGFGHLVLEKPNNLLYRMKYGHSDYTFAATETGIVEIERGNKTYAEWPTWDRLQMPVSRISDTLSLGFPPFFLWGNLNSKIFTSYDYVGRGSIGAIQVDHIRGSGQDAKVDLFIADDGHILRYALDLVRGQKHLQSELDFSNYVVNHAVASNTFVVKVPPGSHVYSLPTLSNPLEIGESFPAEGWFDAASRQRRSASEFYRDKPALFVAVSPDSEPSARTAGSLGRLNGTSVNVVLISTLKGGGVPSALNGLPQLYDPAGSTLRSLRSPGCPMFYLVDTSGKINRLWLGFDPAKAGAFEREVQEALKNPAGP
jgi:hypothetical protein